ncbi:hypothetical protein BSNK01_07400 [Bacillaceae bacterium]
MQRRTGTIAQLKALLDEWRGSPIAITKEEDGDVDQTIMTLDKTTFVERAPTIDGYVSPLSLRLDGEGRTILETSAADLPYASYDIPVEEVYDLHFDGGQIHLTTSRGAYRISRC